MANDDSKHEIVHAAASLVPGGGLLKLLSESLKIRNIRLADEFLAQVVEHLQAGDVLEAHVELQSKMDEQWAQEAIAAGFETVRNTYDSEARSCIAALVADYLKSQTMPDRFYRRAANLLQDCDPELLGQLRKVCEGVLSTSRDDPGVKYFLRVEHKTSGYVTHVLSEYKGGTSQSTPFTTDAPPEVLADLLVKHSFGHRPNDTSDKSRRLQFDENVLKEWPRLRLYLEVSYKTSL